MLTIHLHEMPTKLELHLGAPVEELTGSKVLDTKMSKCYISIKIRLPKVINSSPFVKGFFFDFCSKPLCVINKITMIILVKPLFLPSITRNIFSKYTGEHP